MSRKDRSSDIALYQQGSVDAFPAVHASPPPTEQQSLWALVHDRLNGRWTRMFALGGALSVCFGVVGFLSTSATYRSQGAIRIAPRLTTVLDPIPETGQLPYFQSFVATQVQFVRSRRVLENALDNPDLKALSWARQPDALEKMESNLDVESDRHSELIFVSFEAPDSKVAQTVCNAVIKSYDQIHGRAGGSETGQTLQRLYDLEAQLVRDLRTTHADIQRIHSRHQTTDLRELHTTKSVRLDEIEQQIAAAELVLARLEKTGFPLDEDTASVVGPLLQQLEAIDPRLAELRRWRDGAVMEFELAKQRYLPESAKYNRALERAQTMDRLFQEEYVKALEQWDRHGFEAVPGAGLEGFFEGLPPARLAEEIGNLKQRATALRQEGEQLINDIQLLSSKEFDADRIQSDLDRTQHRIQGLELEGESIASRISVVQEATTPLSEYSDGRKKRAVAGLIFGFMLSFGAFFMLGSIDRKTFGAGQLRSSAGALAPRCLGVLPDLGAGLQDPESGDVASHCVHQIRNQIEVLRDPSHGYVLAVSSPFQGDGKTSIVMALGWSYAAAGYRTLLVDCDLVGRSLTRQLGMVGREGLKEALARRVAAGTIADLPVQHLSVLPVGVDARVGPETLRQIDLRAILDQIRDQYDMIVLDTGPLLGSLESTPVTAAADGVVLSLKRGRSRARLEECVRRIQAVHANCIGVILNGVGRSECSRYVSEASIAAAEVERHSTDREDGERQSVVHGASDGRNALMLAMESKSRTYEPPEKEADSAHDSAA